MKLYDDPDEEKKIWEVREAGLGATARVPDEPVTWEGWEDSAVPPEKVGIYLRALRKLFEKYKYGCSLYGHFGEGCIHTRIDFGLKTKDGIEKYQKFVARSGGTGRQSRRLDFRRTRRRTIESGFAADHVWRGIDSGVSRIQKNLGPAK